MPPTFIGIALKVLSAALFAAMAACIKLAMNGGVPVGQAMAARAFFAVFPILVAVWWAGPIIAALKTERPLAHASRTLIGGTGMFLGFAALSYIPLHDATALGYAAPIFTVILAAIILKEKVRIYRWSAVVVGLVGVLVMLLPYLGAGVGEGHVIGSALALLGAVFTAYVTIYVRQMTRTEGTYAIVFWFSIGGTLLALLSIPFGWVWPTPSQAALLIGAGVLGGIAQIAMTASFRLADASLVAPFDYTSLLFAVALGFLLFGDVPTPAMVAGAAIVIAAGLFVIWREHRLGLERRREMETGRVIR